MFRIRKTWLATKYIIYDMGMCQGIASFWTALANPSTLFGMESDTKEIYQKLFSALQQCLTFDQSCMDLCLDINEVVGVLGYLPDAFTPFITDINQLEPVMQARIPWLEHMGFSISKLDVFNFDALFSITCAVFCQSRN